MTREVNNAIYKSHVRLALFRGSQGSKCLNLVKPQRTRWSSYFLAFQSTLKLRGSVELALKGSDTVDDHAVLAKLTPKFWLDLQDIVDLLKPFSWWIQARNCCYR